MYRNIRYFCSPGFHVIVAPLTWFRHTKIGDAADSAEPHPLPFQNSQFAIVLMPAADAVARHR